MSHVLHRWIAGQNIRALVAGSYPPFPAHKGRQGQSCVRTCNWQDSRNDLQHMVLAHDRDVGNFESTAKVTT